jgi:hypothetical protein
MAAETFLLKRGTTAAVNAYLPAVGEPVYDITLKQFKIGDGVTLGGVPPLNVLTADKLTTARDIALTGAVTGTVSFDGSANVSLATAVGTALQTSIDLKAPLASPTFTGVPSVPTAAPLTNTTQAASTAYVEAARAVLSAVDALKAPLASPALTGVPTAPTAALGTNTNQLATMAAIISSIVGTTSQAGGVPTGAAQEYTTGANGDCWRFANGLQICAITKATGATNSAAGTLFTSAAAPVGSFTKNFTAAPIVLPIGTGSGGGGWGSLYVAPTTSTWGSWAVYNHVSSASPATISLIAIGRWF